MKLIALLPLFFTAALTALAAPQSSPLEDRGAPVGCMQCNPAPLAQPQCDITTSCVLLPKASHPGSTPPPNYCACRAGYKANPRVVGVDPAAQWRLPWEGQEGRVFVRPSTVCDTLCDFWQLGKDGCKEVPEYANCM